MRRSTNSKGTGSTGRLCRSPATATDRLPSPPPPPQRRRSSLAMSLPSLENFLSQAPPADLTAGTTLAHNTNYSNANTIDGTSRAILMTPTQTSGLARRSSLAAGPMRGITTTLPPHSFYLNRLHPQTSVLERLTAAASATATGDSLPPAYANVNATSSTTTSNINNRLRSARKTPQSTALVAASSEPISTGDTLPTVPPTTTTTRRTSLRLREVGQKRSAEAAAAVVAAATSLSHKRRKAPPPSRRKAPPPSRRDSSGSSHGIRRSSHSATTITAPEACCICLSVPEINDVASINGCNHSFCYACIQTWSETENSCPLCKQRFTTIGHARANNENSAASPTVSVQRVPTRNQRSEAGIALDGLLANLTGGLPIHRSSQAAAGLLLDQYFPTDPNNQNHNQLGRLLLRSLGAPPGSTGGLGYPPASHYASIVGQSGGAAAGMPMASLAGIGGLALQGYSGGNPLAMDFGGHPFLQPPDNLFEPTFLNVILQSSTVTTTTTSTTSVGLIPTIQSVHSPVLNSLVGPSAAAYMTAYNYTPPPLSVAAAAVAGTTGSGGGFTLDTAIEINDSDDDILHHALRHY